MNHYIFICYMDEPFILLILYNEVKVQLKETKMLAVFLLITVIMFKISNPHHLVNTETINKPDLSVGSS